jgi:hypothetical protein
LNTRIVAKNVTFKLGDVQQLAEQKLASVTMEEWAAVCRYVKAVEEESRVESTRWTAPWNES